MDIGCKKLYLRNFVSLEEIFPFKMHANNMSNNFADEYCMECSYTDLFGNTGVRFNDNLRIMQCVKETHHPDEFVFKRGEEFFTRTMCVSNPPNNGPTPIFFDKKCEGFT